MSRDSVESIGALQKIKKRGEKRKNNDKIKINVFQTYDLNKISSILKELLERSDVMDEEFGKSITL